MPFRRSFAFFVISTILISCSSATEKKTRFSLLPGTSTGISFRNDIQENQDLNIDVYEYLYNGGGVAAADFNNDGKTDLFFSGNMSPDKLYLNQGDFHFTDATVAAGIVTRASWKTGVATADINGDGLVDIYLCYSGPDQQADKSNQLFLNTGVQNGVPHFREAAAEFGLDAPGTLSTMASFFDMDNDGDLDCFLVNHADMFYNPFFNTEKLRQKRHPRFGNRLYRNDNNRFTDISEAAGIYGGGLNFGLGVAIADINGDGRPDIFVGNDYDERDFLYLNQGNGVFREVLDTAARHISEFSMGADIADYNNDLLPDLVVMDMLPEDNYRQKTLKGADGYDKYKMRERAGFHRQQMRNVLQLNNGNDKQGIPVFSEVAQFAGIAATDWSWSPLFADFDNDGWKDLFVSNGVLRDMTNLDFVKYTLPFSSKSNSPTADKAKTWELVKNMETPPLHNYIFRNEHDLRFSNRNEDWGMTRTSVNNGAAYADLDNDGDLDLVVNTLNNEAGIYRNNSEKEATHWLQVRLKGDAPNTQAIGATVTIETESGQQSQSLYLQRGFQSSVEAILHFGLDSNRRVQRLQVSWPDGSRQTLTDIPADSLLTIRQSPDGFSPKTPPPARWFVDVTASSGIDFVQQAPTQVDFKLSPLLPYELSKVGPALAKADVNGDGREDLFIGATAPVSTLYLQQPDGRFMQATAQPWQQMSGATYTDALFFDADKDGDADLYLVTGGAESVPQADRFSDRFFENQGGGRYAYVPGALSDIRVSGSIARSADINHDGLPDLFVGGRHLPGRFPASPESQVLLNKSQPGAIRFEAAPLLPSTRLGMVSDALFTDINNDGWSDLVVAGEFMPIRLFRNQQGRLVEDPLFGNSDGWWQSLAAVDVNNDGFTDIVAGNIGYNLPFAASEKEPVSLVYGPYFNSQTIHPVLTWYSGGIQYPWYSKDELAEQIPSIQKKYLKYSDYGKASIENLVGAEAFAKAPKLFLKQTASLLLLNRQGKGFTRDTLPNAVQTSVTQSVLAGDYNGDGYADLITAGNFYPMRVQVGAIDAGIGSYLAGDGHGGFSVQPYARTGLRLNGDVRKMVSLQTGNGPLLVTARAGGPVTLHRMQVPFLVAHRGGMVDSLRPENSLPALQAAYRAGFSAVEIDLRLTRDGQLITQHEADFKRYFGVAKKTTELTAGEIAALRSSVGTRVLTLEEVLRYCQGKMAVMLDNKIAGNDTAVWNRLLALLDRYQLRQSAFLIGTDESTDFFRGKIRLSASRQQLEENQRRTGYRPEQYFLFSDQISAADVTWAKANGILPMGVVNAWRLERSKADVKSEIDQLKSTGLQHFQIDAVYLSFF